MYCSVCVYIKRCDTACFFSSVQTILKSRTATEPVRSERENLPPKTRSGLLLNLKVCCCSFAVLTIQVMSSVIVIDHENQQRGFDSIKGFIHLFLFLCGIFYLISHCSPKLDIIGYMWKDHWSVRSTCFSTYLSFSVLICAMQFVKSIN